MNDDTLLLYFYDELPDDEAAAVRRALAHDASIADRYRRLREALSAISDEATPPLSADRLARFQATIDRAADREAGRRPATRARVHFLSFLLGTAVTAAVAVAIGLALRQDVATLPAGTPIAMTTEPAPSTTSPFARSLQVYFRESQLGLQGLPDNGNGERTQMIRDLIAQNRMFAKLAVENDAPQLARVLRAFEPILARLAREDISAEESAALREKLEFELNVMLTKVTRDASEFARNTEQET